MFEVRRIYLGVVIPVSSTSNEVGKLAFSLERLNLVVTWGKPSADDTYKSKGDSPPMCFSLMKMLGTVDCLVFSRRYSWIAGPSGDSSSLSAVISYKKNCEGGGRGTYSLM